MRLSTVAVLVAVVVCCTAQDGRGAGREVMPGIMEMARTGDPPRRRRPMRVPLHRPEVSVARSHGDYIADSRLTDAPIVFPGLLPKRDNDVAVSMHTDFIVGSGRDPVVIDRVISGVDPSVDDVAPQDGVMSLPDNLDMDLMDIATSKMISGVSSSAAFLKLLGVQMPTEDTTDGPTVAAVRFGGRGVPTTPLQAVCEPENVTVTLNLPKEEGILFFPTCVRLQRCGGCCTNNLLSCQSTDITKHTFKVVRVSQSPPQSERSVNTNAVGGSRGRSRGSRRRRRSESSYYYVDEVEHTSCSCKCRIQPQHCDPQTQSYSQSNCLCVCNNLDEQTKCSRRTSDHHWDNLRCKCVCNKIEHCSTTQYFDDNSCTCKSLHLRPAHNSGAGVLTPRVGDSFADRNAIDGRADVDGHVRRRHTFQ